MSMSKPKITDRIKPPLPHDVRAVLAALFSGYQEVVVKSEFQSGFSGSRVFLVRPIQEDGAELPAVVKIDRVARIKREWLAYKAHIQNRLPHGAEVRGKPVYPSGNDWGGLWYPLVGAGTFDIESLHQYCQHADIKDILHVLESRLFKSLNTLWTQTGKVRSELHLQTEYDSFLPVNLVVELAKTESHDQPHLLHPATINEHAWITNDYVQLSGFRVVNVAYKAKRLSLDVPLDANTAYRVHVYPVPDIEKYVLGEVIQRPFVGFIRKTRQELLQEQAATALGSSVDVTAANLTLTDGTILPNPLLNLSALLNRMFDAHVSYIHGDLHLQNVLVEPENRNAYLIDFSHAGRKHVLRDLLQLETAVVTQLLPDVLTQTKQTPAIIISFYERLHCAMQYPSQVNPPPGLEKPFAILQSIRKAARPHLFQENSWDEYYYGLIIYLLGSLKFDSLNELPTSPYPKQLAFWGAAVTLNLLETSPPCAEMLVGQTPATDAKVQQEKRESSRTQTETHFHGPVTGQIHTGSGDINITRESAESTSGLEPETKTRYRDAFSSYDVGTQRLLAQMRRNHPRYLEALGYQDRLRDNVDRSRRFGDTSLRKADRAEIIEQLNELSLSVTGISFNELGQGKS